MKTQEEEDFFGFQWETLLESLDLLNYRVIFSLNGFHMSSGLYLSHGQDLFHRKAQAQEGTLNDRRMVMLREIRHCVILPASVWVWETERPPLNYTHLCVLPGLARIKTACMMRVIIPPTSPSQNSLSIWNKNEQKEHENKFGHQQIWFWTCLYDLLSLSPIGGKCLSESLRESSVGGKEFFF